MGGILAFLSAAFAQLFGSSVAQFLAFKIVLYALFVTVLPVVLNNVFTAIVEGAISLAGTAIGSGGPSNLIEYTGVAAALVSLVGLPAAFSVVVAACAFKLSLRLIPFFRL